VNSGHLANPVSQSLIVASGALLQCTLSSLAAAAMDPIVPSYSWDSDEETEQSTKPKKYKGTATILEDQEWKH
jgi:hypothetical protein